MERLSEPLLLDHCADRFAKIIRTDGFYYLWKASVPRQTAQPGSAWVFYFYKDGICLGSNVESEDDRDSIAAVLSRLYSGEAGKRRLEVPFMWGHYRCGPDTLQIEYYGGAINSRLYLLKVNLVIGDAEDALRVLPHAARETDISEPVIPAAAREFNFYPIDQKPDPSEFTVWLSQKRLEAVQRKAKKEGK